MLTKKVTELTETTTTSGSDVLYIVDNSSGSPISKKITTYNFFGSIYGGFTKPILGNYTWVNQGGATATTNIDIYGGIYIYAPPNSGDSARVVKKTAPTPPYTITAWIMPHSYAANYFQIGIGWRQSSDGKLCTLFIGYSTAAGGSIIASAKWNTATSYNDAYNAIGIFQSQLYCLRIQDDNINRICSWSSDGKNFYSYHTVSRTDFMTGDEVLFYSNSNNVTYPSSMTLLSWEES